MKKYIYIDESGTLGLKNSGIEPYFTIAVLILEEHQKKPIKNLVKKLTKELLIEDPTIDELHACKMSFPQKQRFFNLFKAKDSEIRYLVARKDQIHINLFNNKPLCFNYFLYLVLEPLLRDENIIELEILIDNRNVKIGSLKSLEDYLNTKLIEFGFFLKKVSAQYGDSANFKHLQAVDVIANAIHSKYNWNKKPLYLSIKPLVSKGELFPQNWFTQNN